MLRTVPSHAVEAIEKIFPRFSEVSRPSHDFTLYPGNEKQISVILGIIDFIPDDLITASVADSAAFAASISLLKATMSEWQKPSHGAADGLSGPVPGFEDDPIQIIHDVLAKCQDEAPAASTTELQFILDTDLRNALRLDVSTAHSALRNGEWKAATVIAGSVVEALLLAALQQRTAADIANARQAVVTSAALQKAPPADLLAWGLGQYVAVAHNVKIITDPTAAQCKIAQEFRNLIHPGRAQRLQLKCSRGTAHAAVGAMEQVIEDLT